MTRKYSKRVSSEAKVEALQKHLTKKVPVSEICEDLDIQPSVFYNWQRELFARGSKVFDVKRGPKAKDTRTEEIERLKAKMIRKDEVIAELLEDHVALKKSLGET